METKSNLYVLNHLIFETEAPKLFKDIFYFLEPLPDYIDYMTIFDRESHCMFGLLGSLHITNRQRVCLTLLKRHLETKGYLVFMSEDVFKVYYKS